MTPATTIVQFALWWDKIDFSLVLKANKVPKGE